jgi:hypothetical protein
MVDDTFTFSVVNPATVAFFDILSGKVKTGTLLLDLIESGSVDFDHDLVDFEITVKNTGETAATKDIVMYDASMVELERESLTLNPDETAIASFNNTAAHYTIPNGGSEDFTVKSG